MASTDTATRVLENYVGGRWTASASTELLDVTNPATGEDLAGGRVRHVEDVGGGLRGRPLAADVVVEQPGRRSGGNAHCKIHSWSGSLEMAQALVGPAMTFR